MESLGEITDVVPSHAALGTVASWLGLSVEEAMEEAGPSNSKDEDMKPSRGHFLGLGAKYVPHHKAAHFVDVKLKRRLEKTQSNGQDLSQSTSLSEPKFDRWGFLIKKRPLSSSGKGDSDDTEEDEDLGKSQSFGGKTATQVAGPIIKAIGKEDMDIQGNCVIDGAAETQQLPSRYQPSKNQEPCLTSMTAKQRQQYEMLSLPHLNAQKGSKRKKKKKIASI